MSLSKSETPLSIGALWRALKLHWITAAGVTNLPLRMEYFSACVFHLIDFYDAALSDGVLNVSQYGQPWTVHSATRSRPSAATGDGPDMQALKGGWQPRKCP